MKNRYESVSAAKAHEILALAASIHRRMGFRLPPFRFEEFFACYDSYRVFEADLPAGLDGKVFLSPDGERKTIYLRRQNTRTRLRFTLAHEVIHAEFHFPRGELPDLKGCRTGEHPSDGRRKALEREADFGAAALLMPLWMIDRFVPAEINSGYPDHVVREIARLFRVSEAAMRAQLRAYRTLRRQRERFGRMAAPACVEPGVQGPTAQGAPVRRPEP